MGISKTLHMTWLNLKIAWKRTRWLNVLYLMILPSVFFVIIFFLVDLPRFCPEIEDFSAKALHQSSCNSSLAKPLTFVAYGRDVDSGHLRHVFDTFKTFGYGREKRLDDDWDVMWSHDYPFQKLSPIMKNLKPHQRVNHFPGMGFITNKMDLATAGSRFIPKAFKIPGQKTDLLKYASENPSKMFVQKSNDHRGIKIKGLDKIDLDTPGSFVQEYITNPLLVDGYKFDIGVYTAITSFDPLRVYIYNGDALFRYCPLKYYPFDPEKLDKYVIGDDYLPTWDVPSLKRYYTDNGFSMKESFNAYMLSLGRDPRTIWVQIEEAIRDVTLSKESQIMRYVSLYKSKRNFFEMMRFDFVVDDNLNVFIMEANMSPNLSSAHFIQNQLLYEQVLYNLFSLVGLGTRLHTKEERVLVSDKNLMVSPIECVKCANCVAPECQLCKQCLDGHTERILKDSYLEHMNKKDYKRIFPAVHANLTFQPDHSHGPENLLLTKWFHEKCQIDSSWC